MGEAGRTGWACIASLVIALPGPALAVDYDIESRIGAYVDDDATRVVTPRVRLTASPDSDTEIGIAYAVDVISSASVDVVSAATKRFSENRHEIIASGAHRIGDSLLSGTIAYSRENDFVARSVGVALRHEVNDRNTSFELGLSGMRAAVGMGGTPLDNFSRRLDNEFGGRLTVGQILSPTAEGTVTYELNHLDGYQASPYRFVDVYDDALGGDIPMLRIPERVPRQRTRQAISVRAAWSPMEGLGLHGAARAYADSWGLLAGTGELAAKVLLPARLRTGLRARGYLQSGASFYQPIYNSPKRYVTVGRKLAPMWNVLAGFELGWALAPQKTRPNVHVLIHADLWYFRWPDHPRLSSRRATMLGLEVITQL